MLWWRGVGPVRLGGEDALHPHTPWQVGQSPRRNLYGRELSCTPSQQNEGPHTHYCITSRLTRRWAHPPPVPSVPLPPLFLSWDLFLMSFDVSCCLLAKKSFVLSFCSFIFEYTSIILKQVKTPKHAQMRKVILKERSQERVKFGYSERKTVSLGLRNQTEIINHEFSLQSWFKLIRPCGGRCGLASVRRSTRRFYNARATTTVS